MLDTFSDLPEMGDYALLSKIVKIENRLKLSKVPSLIFIEGLSLKECEVIWPYLLYYQHHKKKPSLKHLSKTGSLKDRRRRLITYFYAYGLSLKEDSPYNRPIQTTLMFSNSKNARLIEIMTDPSHRLDLDPIYNLSRCINWFSGRKCMD